MESRCTACVLLKDVFDYSLGEIAKLVDSTVGGVKAALNRGRSKLASLNEPSVAPRAPTPQNQEILRLYAERFNRQDWDGLRELISADAPWSLPIDTPAASRTATTPVSIHMRVTWRLALGEVDGEPAIVLLHVRDGAWGIESFGSTSAETAESSESPTTSTVRGCSRPDRLLSGNLPRDSRAREQRLSGKNRKNEVVLHSYEGPSVTRRMFVKNSRVSSRIAKAS
jgi:Sigma-70, region 4